MIRSVTRMGSYRLRCRDNCVTVVPHHGGSLADNFCIAASTQFVLEQLLNGSPKE
jgi:hypothetical protein